MIKLVTIYRSNIPIDCHILKGRLETEGIHCFLFDENLICAYPFYAVAIGGVKLKIPSDEYAHCQKIIKLLSQDKLIDEAGEYQISEIFNNEIDRQNEILSIKSKIRNGSALLDKSVFSNSKFIDSVEIDNIMKNEREFQELSKKKFEFSWKQFLYELFDFDRSIFTYFRVKPIDYFIEKEIVENYITPKKSKQTINCPYCNSDNTSFGYAIDIKWDVLYLILSLLIWTPFFPIRKKYHCFDCGHDFKKNKKQLTIKHLNR